MAIDITGAGTYFAGHSKAPLWSQYSHTQKAGAIEQAKRELSRELGRKIKEDEPPYTFGDPRRDEYAVYEQAIHLLGQAGKASTGSGAVPTLKGGSEIPERQSRAKFSEDCLRWLGIRIGVAMIRG